MDIERRTPDNTAIVLIDHVSSFGNIVGSQPLAANIAGARALVQTARAFDVPLVVTLGPRDDPRGGLYPELLEALGDHALVHRAGSFDAFDDAGFVDAVTAAGRRHLVVAGLMTDGCVLQTTLTAMRRDHHVSLVVDATATETAAGHDAALHRLTGHGAGLTSWLSFAAELQRTYDNTGTVAEFRKIQANSPGYRLLQSSIAAAVAAGSRSRH